MLEKIKRCPSNRPRHSFPVTFEQLGLVHMNLLHIFNHVYISKSETKAVTLAHVWFTTMDVVVYDNVQITI